MTENLELAGVTAPNLGVDFVVSGDWLVFVVSESERGEDLTADGDTEDDVVHIHNLSSGETTHLGLVRFESFFAALEMVISGDWLVFFGNLEDRLFHLHHLPTGETTNLEALESGFDPNSFSVSNDWFVFSARPVTDFFDGDLSNRALRVRNLQSSETVDFSVTAGGFRVSGDVLASEISEGPGNDLNGDGDTQDQVVHVHGLLTGETSTLGLAGVVDFGELDLFAAAGWLNFSVSESQQGGIDLNNDGDVDDRVMHVHDLSTGETRNLGLAAFSAPVLGNWLPLVVREGQQGKDLNGDGDVDDRVVHIHDLAKAETTNLGLAGCAGPVSGGWLAFDVLEGQQGEDLNADGDTGDRVVHARELSTGETRNLGIAGTTLQASDGWFLVNVFERQQGEDLNGDGDTDDRISHLVDLASPGEPQPSFVRGDCNSDGEVAGSVTDAVFLLGFNFLGAPEPGCLAACDADSDGEVVGTVSDALYLLTFSFQGGPPPAAPYPGCGVETAEDAVGDCQKPPAHCN